MNTLLPLIERIKADIMASDLLHADNTPIRVLDRSMRDKGLGKGVRPDRICAYVRDQRPWAGVIATRCSLSVCRPERNSCPWPSGYACGILQADGYKGYGKLYEPEPVDMPRLRGNYPAWVTSSSERTPTAHFDQLSQVFDT